MSHGVRKEVKKGWFTLLPHNSVTPSTLFLNALSLCSTPVMLRGNMTIKTCLLFNMKRAQWHQHTVTLALCLFVTRVTDTATILQFFVNVSRHVNVFWCVVITHNGIPPEKLLALEARHSNTVVLPACCNTNCEAQTCVGPGASLHT